MRVILVSIFSFVTIFSQARIGDWDSYTSTLNVHEIINYEDDFICATDGGLLLFNNNSQTFDNINNIDELMGTKLNCLAFDQLGELWIGGGESDGFIQIYDVETRQSIKEFDYDMSEIIDFAISDSIVYAVYRDQNDFGIIEFSYLNDEFIHKDLYPNWPSGNKIYEIEIHNNFVYVATEIGLYKGNLGDDPNNWSRPFTELENSVSNLYLKQNGLYCYSDNTLYLIDLNKLQLSIIRSLSGYLINDILVLPDGAIISFSEKEIYYFNNNNVKQISIPNNSVNSLNFFNNNDVIFGTTTGLAFLNWTEQKLYYLIPNTPLTNNFQAITMLEDGRIVGGSNQGIAIKETNGWRNIVESEKM